MLEAVESLRPTRCSTDPSDPPYIQLVLWHPRSGRSCGCTSGWGSKSACRRQILYQIDRGIQLVRSDCGSGTFRPCRQVPRNLVGLQL
jgi:hypothetical protein